MFKLRKYVLMAPAVAAAGSLAGSYAAGKLMGLDKKAPPGGGIPGVTSSKGGGKDGTKGSVPQVDPTIALDYFRQASERQNKGYDEGLNFYGTAVTNAGNQVRIGYQQGNNELQGLSYSGKQALAQQMRMLGLEPFQMTATYGDTLRTNLLVDTTTPGEGPKISQGFIDYTNKLADEMDDATFIKDKYERQQALKNLQTGITTNSTNILADLQKQYDAKIVPNAPTLAEFGITPEGQQKYQYITSLEMGGQSPLAWGAEREGIVAWYDDQTRRRHAFDAKTEEWYAEKKRILDEKDSLQKQIDKGKQYSTQLNSMGNDFAREYTPEYDDGYTGDEISEVVTNLPGYQFQMEQGVQAIDRVGAARGMLGSSNTALAEQDYGQKQSMQYYNNYMGYLGGIAAQGAQATGQLSANMINQGNTLASLQQAYGQAQMETERAKADYAANMLYQSGVLFNQTAMFNAGLQFQGQENQKNRDAQAQNTAMAAGPGYMNAQTNAGQLQLAQQNSAGYGQGFLASYGQAVNPYINAPSNGYSSNNYLTNRFGYV